MLTACKQSDKNQSNSSISNSTNISFYEDFLNNDIPATTKNGTIYISDFTRLSDGKSGIDRYTFYNNENYNVPLLHIQALEHSVLYFDGEKVVLLYSSPITRTEGKINILNDGLVYSTYESLGGTQYYFVKFLGDKQIEITEFYDPGSINKDVPFSFNGVQLSKEEFEIKTKPFFESTKFTEDIDWLIWAQKP